VHGIPLWLIEVDHLSAAPDEQEKVGNQIGVGGRRCRPIPPFHAHRFAAIGVSMEQYTVGIQQKSSTIGGMFHVEHPLHIVSRFFQRIHY